MNQSTNIFNSNNTPSPDQTYGNKLYPKNMWGHPQQYGMYDIDAPGSAISNESNTAILVVNSFDRDKSRFPDPSKYSIDLKDEYFNVVAIELTSAWFPNSGYIVDSNNNLIHFQDTQGDLDSGNVRTAEVDIGDWSIDEGTTLSSKIEEALNNASSSNSYVVDVDQNRRKFTISQSGGGTGIFNLLFKGRPMHFDSGKNPTDYFYREKSMGRLLGFNRRDLTGETEYTSDMTYDLRPDNFLVLQIRNLERIDSYNDTIDKSFAIITQDNSLSNYQFAKDSDGINNHRYVKHFISPLPQISSLDIEIRTLEGNLYDFNGQEHYMTFEIQSLSRVESYTDKVKRMNYLRQ